MKRNKLLSVLLVLVMCISLCACGGDKINLISEEELSSYIEVQEITTDNWDDYFEIIEVEEVEKDAFDEETGRRTEYQIFMKEGYYEYESIVLRLTYICEAEVWEEFEYIIKDVEETKDYDFGHSGDRYMGDIYISRNMSDKLVLKDVKCDKAKGSIAKLSIPEEKWNIPEEGSRYLCIGDSEDSFSMIFEEELFCMELNSLFNE